MGLNIGKHREARPAYGFDDISLVPGTITVNPMEVDTSFSIPAGDGRSLRLGVPVLASAMDGIADVRFCTELNRLGGLGILNLNGLQTRYENPSTIIQQIIDSKQEDVTALLQCVYSEPVREDLIGHRIEDLKRNGVPVAVSTLPHKASRYAGLAREAGADVLVVQATVLTARHHSTQYDFPDLKKLCSEMDIPVIAGNVATTEAAGDLMECGVAAVLAGLGPGSACTSRKVLGIGVPQATATADCAAARDEFFRNTGRYVPVITDGGMTCGGDICKALACGADAVMLGAALAKASEAPGKGHHWGMAMPDSCLPRGTRIRVGVSGSLKTILFGPATVDDGSQNLVGAITTAMSYVGAMDIAEFQKTPVVITSPGSWNASGASR
jgi:IMP dehydrogenase